VLAPASVAVKEAISNTYHEYRISVGGRPAKRERERAGSRRIVRDGSNRGVAVAGDRGE